MFEQEVVAALNDQGLEAIMFEATNHPISDIAILSDGDIAAEIQLKATDSASYVYDTLEVHSDVPIIVTSEIAQQIDHEMVIASGLENDVLEQAVSEALAGEAASQTAAEVGGESVSEGLADVVGESFLPFPITPLGIIRALFGIPFL